MVEREEEACDIEREGREGGKMGEKRRERVGLAGRRGEGGREAERGCGGSGGSGDSEARGEKRWICGRGLQRKMGTYIYTYIWLGRKGEGGERGRKRGYIRDVGLLRGCSTKYLAAAKYVNMCITTSLDICSSPF